MSEIDLGRLGEDDDEDTEGRPLTAKEKLQQRMAALKARRLDARKDNHQEVVEEDRKAKLPANYESRKRRAEAEEALEKAKKEAEERGEDYERLRAMTATVEEGERWHRKKKRSNDTGAFTDYEQASYKKYDKLTAKIKPDMGAYKLSLAGKSEEDVDANSITYGQHGKVTEAGIERMVKDLQEQDERRAKRSRRRMFNADADVDYINEKNLAFNKRLEKFYGKHTQEIKESLERGTAL